MRQTEPLPGEEAWVPPPVEGDLLWPRRTIYGGDAAWSLYRGKTHQACTTCIEVLQDHEREPYPRQPPHPTAATKRRKGPNGDSWHCARHGTEMERRDGEIKRRLADLRARTEHVARGQRRRR